MAAPPHRTLDPKPAESGSWTDAIASFMRRVHVRAKHNEWIVVHRGGQNTGPSNGGNNGWPIWLIIVAVIGGVWLASVIVKMIYDALQLLIPIAIVGMVGVIGVRLFLNWQNRK